MSRLHPDTPTTLYETRSTPEMLSALAQSLLSRKGEDISILLPAKFSSRPVRFFCFVLLSFTVLPHAAPC
jgi:hypothetical protein